ncbi:MAG: site-specific integrase [bacterium]|nr:site-specific integrase [bacterium]
MKTSLDFLFFLRTQNCLKENTCLEYARLAKYLGNNLESALALKKFCLSKQRSGTQAETLNKYLKVARWWCLFTQENWYHDLKKFRCFPKHKPTLNENELKEFVNLKTNPVLDAFWLLHCFSGTRPSEVARLQLNDFDLDNNCFYPQNTKTNDGKPIILFAWVKEEILPYLRAQNGPFAFSFNGGPRPLSLRTVEKDCQLRLRLMHCDKHITPHSFRHTFATIGIASGKVPIQYMQRLLRHSRITTTMHYLDQSVDFMREAAAVHPYHHFTA